MTFVNGISHTGIHALRGSVMIDKMEPAIAGVVCLHCGMDTPLPNSTSRGRSEKAFVTSKPRLALIRCTGCGKEAPYLANQIVILGRTSNAASCAA